MCTTLSFQDIGNHWNGPWEMPPEVPMSVVVCRDDNTHMGNATKLVNSGDRCGMMCGWCVCVCVCVCVNSCRGLSALNVKEGL